MEQRGGHGRDFVARTARPALCRFQNGSGASRGRFFARSPFQNRHSHANVNGGVRMANPHQNYAPTRFARIGVMRAFNRHVERVFDPLCKESMFGGSAS